eukprot:CAMPEP_0201556712 /NCGR_PEP_ID=MMETSP0173_2-20130828/57352_1 /ASSEMBLY_ACC=CAM_ASM_000268 /TAXON_ID=218659 /ORGANISM="Vexillifera sp., Strain DIVA3 564/2" /LENGTH=255 /DNA_ID=CAMNT_0047969159 /DNA_START=146 /DNA_END=910 /DNA_ORIENTATION=+
MLRYKKRHSPSAEIPTILNHQNQGIVTDQDYQQCIEQAKIDIHHTYGVAENIMGTKIVRESIIFGGGGRASLLQLAHPFIATAIDRKSALGEYGVSQRFYGTFKWMFRMVFGNRKSALQASAVVRKMHNRIVGRFTQEDHQGMIHFPVGSEYLANSRAAQVWVWATLFDSMILQYEMFVQHLTDAQCELIYAQQFSYLLLFGLRPTDIPPNYRAFRAYCAGMWHSDILACGPPAHRVSSYLFHAPHPLFKPALAW